MNINSNKNDYNNVVENSLMAYNEWSQVTPLKRSRIISKYKEFIENSDYIQRFFLGK